MDRAIKKRKTPKRGVVNDEKCVGCGAFWSSWQEETKYLAETLEGWKKQNAWHQCEGGKQGEGFCNIWACPHCFTGEELDAHHSQHA
jgi:hypothetical protein